MNPSTDLVAVRPEGPARLLAGLVLAAMGCVLLWKVSIFLDRARWAVSTPHELDYGEGIVWQQMRMIMDGRGYAPLQTFPAIVFHYPPVYHLLTWVVASMSGAGDLAAGRALSTFSTLCAAVLIGVITGFATADASRATRWTCGVTAALVCLTCAPVAHWGVLMRVDMVGFALTLGGLCLSMAALRRPALIYLAAVAFVGAVFTKHTMLAAPGAVFLVLLVLRPGLAARGVAVCVVLGLAVLGGLSIGTHGQFTRHIFGYNINRFSFSRLKQIVHWGREHQLYLGLAIIGLWLSCLRLVAETARGSLMEIRARLKANINAIPLLIAMAYLIATTCLLILIGKVGSGVNYYVEWFLAGSVFVGVCVRQAADVVFPREGNGSRLAAPISHFTLAPILVAVGAMMTPNVGRVDLIKTAADQAQLATLTRWIRASNRPVISDNMVIVREAGKEVVLEPAIIAELTSTGVYDERPLITMIHHGAFAFFVTVGEPEDELFEERYTPAVTAAMYRAYPRIQKMAGLTVHLPKEAPETNAQEHDAI